jgi:hypothetical protein
MLSEPLMSSWVARFTLKLLTKWLEANPVIVVKFRFRRQFSTFGKVSYRPSDPSSHPKSPGWVAAAIYLSTARQNQGFKQHLMSDDNKSRTLYNTSRTLLLYAFAHLAFCGLTESFQPTRKSTTMVSSRPFPLEFHSKNQKNHPRTISQMAI